MNNKLKPALINGTNPIVSLVAWRAVIALDLQSRGNKGGVPLFGIRIANARGRSKDAVRIPEFSRRRGNIDASQIGFPARAIPVHTMLLIIFLWLV